MLPDISNILDKSFHPMTPRENTYNPCSLGNKNILSYHHPTLDTLCNKQNTGNKSTLNNKLATKTQGTMSRWQCRAFKIHAPDSYTKPTMKMKKKKLDTCSKRKLLVITQTCIIVIWNLFNLTDRSSSLTGDPSKHKRQQTILYKLNKY